MRGKALVALVVLAAFALTVVAPASAHTKVFPTTIEGAFASTTPTDGGFLVEVDGFLTSPKHKCLKRRTVKFYILSGGTKTLKDVDLSSLNGEWGARGVTTAHPDGFTAKVTRKRIDRRLGPRHRHICGADSLTEG